MAYNEILDTEIQPNAPITTSLMTRLRDNPLVRSIQVFTSSGTWTKPQGCEQVLVISVGGGGGGGDGSNNGSNGGNSSFGSFHTANGGNANSGDTGGDGGNASGATININGGDGGDARQNDASGSDLINRPAGHGGSSILGGGPRGGRNGQVYGSGGGGRSGVGSNAGGAGGAGGACIDFIETGLGATETVTVGAGGNGSSAGNVDGADGIVIVWEFYGTD